MLRAGRLATSRRGDRTPAPPPPTYAVAPSVGSEATTARGEQAGRRNPRAATGAHRGPPRGSGALPGGGASGGRTSSAATSRREVCGPKLRRRWHCGIGQRRWRPGTTPGREIWPGEGRRHRPDQTGGKGGTWPCLGVRRDAADARRPWRASRRWSPARGEVVDGDGATLLGAL